MHEHNTRVAADSNGLRATFEDIDVGRSLGDVLAQVELWQVRRHSFQDHLSDKRFDTAANPYQSAKVYRKVIDMAFTAGSTTRESSPRLQIEISGRCLRRCDRCAQ